jgi:hypothetical protein
MGLAKRLTEGFPRCHRREGPSALSCAAWRPAASIVADSQAFSPAPKRLQPGPRGAFPGRDRERLHGSDRVTPTVSSESPLDGLSRGLRKTAQDKDSVRVSSAGIVGECGMNQVDDGHRGKNRSYPAVEIFPARWQSRDP